MMVPWPVVQTIGFEPLHNPPTQTRINTGLKGGLSLARTSNMEGLLHGVTTD